MRGAAVLAVYAYFLYRGIRPMLAHGSKRDSWCFAAIVVWCAYLSLAKLYQWPFFNIIAPIHAAFYPVGRLLDEWLGGD
ncbi:hypothetical protein ACFQ88_22145 [Paenibacillus sp. NPDC056579]|uniref:hypothetical protein n=1 Tax=unclassified Paenibacillus TaxID=185978 RepID=UPI001EF77267|nr:hypothetical protein [Paenibacillus sp. H1-7]ULL14088.1 hypothetical protein DVH26_06300 [Paenibacillus sp. H1-7]